MTKFLETLKAVWYKISMSVFSLVVFPVIVIVLLFMLVVAYVRGIVSIWKTW